MLLVAVAGTCLVQLASAQDLSEPEQLLKNMPCGVWVLLHKNNWDGNSSQQIAVEKWTIQFLRKYAEQVATRAKLDGASNETSKRAQGVDVSDHQILNWIDGYCQKNPKDPFFMSAFLLTAAFRVVPDHGHLPPPPHHVAPHP